jgi:hypothetical protein
VREKTGEGDLWWRLRRCATAHLAPTLSTKGAQREWASMARSDPGRAGADQWHQHQADDEQAAEQHDDVSKFTTNTSH